MTIRYHVAELSLALDADGTVIADFVSGPWKVEHIALPTPRPALRTVSGAQRDGADITGASYENREIELRVRSTAAGATARDSAEQAVRQALRQARRFSEKGWGRYLTLRYRETTSSALAIADILVGDLDAADLADFSPGAKAIDRFSNGTGTYTLHLVCAPYLRGAQVTLAAQAVANDSVGIQYRYLFDSPTLRAANIANRVAGPLWVDTNTSPAQTTTTQITPASGDYVALGDPDGTFTRLSFGVSTPLAYSVIPVWALEYSKAAGAWAALPGVTIYSDANPSGVALAAATDPFTAAGEVELRFAAPADWALSTADGLTSAYYLRLRQTATLGTGLTQPVLQWGPFRNGRGLVRIDAAQISGDAPARCQIKIDNASGQVLRRYRAALFPALRKPFGIPVPRHEAEYAAVANAGAVDTSTFAASAIRGEGVIKVGSATTDFRIAFDGATNGYLDFGTTAIGTLSTPWTIDFWLRLGADAVTGQVSESPMPIFGSWDSASNKRKLLILLDDRKLTVLLSTNGTDVIAYDEPYTKKGAANTKARLLQNPTPLKANTEYFCRVTRTGERIGLYIAEATGTSVANFNGQTFNTKAVTGKADTLGTTALYTAAPVAFRLGQQVDVAAADTTGGAPVAMLNGWVDQLRVMITDQGSTMPNATGKKGQVTGNDTSGNTKGLFEFNSTPGVLVNSISSGTPMATPATRSGAGTADVVGKWATTTYADIQATLALSWALLDGYRGAYRVLAVVRSASATTHAVSASQGGYRLWPADRSVTASGAWQILDLGLANLPYQPGGSFSPFGPTTDPAEALGLAVGNAAASASDFYLDEILLVPLDHWYALYDAGATTARGIQSGESVLFSSLTEPPLAIQLAATGKQRHNPDRNGTLDEPPLLPPGTTCWIFVDVTRMTSLESHPADTATVTVTVEPQTLSVDQL